MSTIAGKNRAISRRAFAAALATMAFVPRTALASPRLPVGGKARLHLPWSLASIDPHRLDDVAAAVLHSALFDSLYALDASGEAVPALAEALPESDGAGGLRIRMREGLTTAHGSPIDARDASLSIARARARGGSAWLAALPSPRREGERALVFPGTDPAALGRLLASPLTAVVPLAFDPQKPDGTGPFKLDRKEGVLVLTRNARAALGPALLDEVDVGFADDLAASLRAFESGADDLGWLGSGLHEPRQGSKTFDAGAVGWAVLVVGHDAAAWDMPGVAQRVCDGIPFARLSYLSMGAPWLQASENPWGGPPIDLLVPSDCPWLVELGSAVAAALSRPSHEVTVRAVSPADFAARRKARTFALAVDAVRSVAPTSFGALVSLATADPASASADLTKHPPKIQNGAPVRALTRTLRLGVLGELRVQGGRVPDLSLPAGASGIDWALATRMRKRS